MYPTINYREQLLKEIRGLPEKDIARIYRVVVVLKEEFIDPDEERYYTESWVEAEREATEDYRRGGLKSYASVDEMVDDILAETDAG